MVNRNVSRCSYIRILLSVPRTIYFNLRYLSIKDAVKLPIWIANNVRVKNMWRGGFIGNFSRIGQIRIGYHQADAVDSYSLHTIIDVRKGGLVHFMDDAHIGQGAIVCVKRNGQLFLGDHFAISGSTSIICSKSINIGSDVQFSWNSLVMDSDSHFIVDEKGIEYTNTSPVIIGSHVWVAANTSILKGSQIGDNTVIASNSMVNKAFMESGVLIGGMPARVIKNIGGWKL